MGRHLCILFILFIIGISGCLQKEHVVQEPLEVVWKYQDLPSDTSHPFFCLCDDRLILHWHRNILYCLSTETGDLLWNYMSSGNFQGDIGCKERKIFVSSKEGESQVELICLNVDTAEMIWKKSDLVLQDYAVTSAYVYVYHEGLTCLDSNTGSEIWKNNQISRIHSITADEKTVVVGLYEKEGEESLYTLYCLDGRTGKILWIGRHDNTHSGLLMAGDMLYNLNTYGVQCHDFKTGTMIWRNDCGRVYQGTAAAGRIYVVPWGEDVFCLDAESGQELWRFEIVGKEVEMYHPVGWVGSWLSPYIGDGCVYTGSQVRNPYVYCLDAETGVMKWRFEKGEQWMSAPVVKGALLFYATDHGVYCYRRTDDG
ncbi:MAG: PQQ-binding-like beta-propeller repeat protein [Candidatus Thorarchaeota archaeon]|jgi:outer membrane protein assembly factor BamB